MPIVHQTRAEFVRQTLAKHGFGKGEIVVRPMVKKHNFEKPEKSIWQVSNERFSEQARATVVRILTEHKRQREEAGA